MASGLSFVIGYYPMDVFGEASSLPEGVIEIDFLNGRVVRGNASQSLKAAAARFAEVLPTFCKSNGAHAEDFEALSATFDVTGLDQKVLVTVSDRNGHRSVTEYAGVPLKRLRALDSLGRVRRTPRRTIAPLR